jgi:type IV pilus assembly protein PilC
MTGATRRNVTRDAHPGVQPVRTGTRRIPDAVLADVLGRLALALGAGIDVRRAWASETERVPRRWQRTMAAVGDGLADGVGLGVAMECAGGFPPLVTALATVGDRTGHEAELLGDAGAALRHAIRSRRALARGLVKPAIQLALAVAVIGLLILVSGGVQGLDGRSVDMVGLGLSGARGLAVFAGAVVAAGIGVVLIGALAARSWAAHGMVRRVVAGLPGIGSATRAAEAAAWCRAASVASGVGLDVGSLVTLTARVAPGLGIRRDVVEDRIRAGSSLVEALRERGSLPRSVLEAVAVGEMTGTTAETLDREATLLEERARDGFTAAVAWIGWLAWAGVAVLVALVVWRFFSFYVGLLNDALAWGGPRNEWIGAAR